MRRPTGVLPRLLWLTLPVLMANECFEDDGAGEDILDPGPDRFSVVVSMENRGDQPVHIFAPGEDFPCCRVEAGGVRNKTMTVERSTNVVFRAGRSQQIVATETCTVAPGATETRSWAITYWDAQGSAANPCGGRSCIGCSGSGWR